MVHHLGQIGREVLARKMGVETGGDAKVDGEEVAAEDLIL